MRRHRFYTNENLVSGRLQLTDPDIAKQLIRVLRLKTGDPVILTDGRGSEAEASIINFHRDEVVFEVGVVNKFSVAVTTQLTLAAAILKRENFELILQKATECGVSTIVPLITARTVKLGFNRERYERILKEALEQSGGVWLPSLAEPMPLAEAMMSSKGEAFFLDPSGDQLNLPLKRSASSRTCFVGPEGGWSDDEIKLARDNECHVLSLGKLTLRAETAAIVAAYLFSRF